MARIIYQDRAYSVPDVEIDGASLANDLNVPSSHDLVLVRPEGNQLVSRGRKVRPINGDYFVDAPTFEYGSTPGR